MKNAMAHKGLSVGELDPGELLSLMTRNRRYLLTYLGERRGLLSGHPEFCREPTPVRIEGSTWGGSMIEIGFLGEGRRAEFVLPDGHTLTTSTVIEIKRAPLQLPLAA
jgi:hypothetical protein